jgi:leucyl/phenylalanyl-tRNA--protein transferase
LAYLVHFLKQNGVEMIDCQQETAHLSSLGASPITRAEFLALIQPAIAQPDIVSWHPSPLF